MPSQEPRSLGSLAKSTVGGLEGVGDKRREALATLGVHTVLDLVTFYPRRWIDRTNEARVSDLVPGQVALVLVTVRSVAKRQTRNRRSMVTASVGDGSGRLSVVFFNQPWRERQLRPDLQVALFGKADVYRGGLQMTNPVVDLIGDRTGRIVPIYPQSEKAAIATWEIAGVIDQALKRWDGYGIPDPVPVEIRKRYGLLDRRQAFLSIHTPETMGEKERARRRLAFDELLRVQLVLVLRKRRLEQEAAGFRHEVGRCAGAALPRAPPLRADRRAAANHRRDRGRSGRPPPDAPAAAGRRGVGQDRRGRLGPAGGGAGRPSGRAHGADRGAGRAARRLGAGAAGRRERAGRQQPLRRSSVASGAPDQPGDGRRAPRGPGRHGRRQRRSRHRHPRPHPGGRWRSTRSAWW